MRTQNVNSLIHRLKVPLYAVGIHGRTGIQTEDGMLPVGTRIRNVSISTEQVAGCPEHTYFFEASTDGKHWFEQKSYGPEAVVALGIRPADDNVRPSTR